MWCEAGASLTEKRLCPLNGGVDQHLALLTLRYGKNLRHALRVCAVLWAWQAQGALSSMRGATAEQCGTGTAQQCALDMQVLT